MEMAGASLKVSRSRGASKAARSAPAARASKSTGTAVTRAPFRMRRAGSKSAARAAARAARGEVTT